MDATKHAVAPSIRGVEHFEISPLRVYSHRKHLLDPIKENFDFGVLRNFGSSLVSRTNKVKVRIMVDEYIID